MYKEDLIVLTEKEKKVQTLQSEKVAEQDDFVIKKSPKENLRTQSPVRSEEISDDNFDEEKKTYSLRDIAKRQKELLSEKERQEEVKTNSSSIIEKPNYDFIEPLTPAQEEKIFKIERQEKEATKPKINGKRLRMAIFSILLAVFGVWGIANVAKIDLLQQSYNALYEQYYNINLPNYLKNLGQLDAVNQGNMDNLFETIPEEAVPPATVEKKSNWFDRLCEFLVGLFGG